MKEGNCSQFRMFPLSELNFKSFSVTIELSKKQKRKKEKCPKMINIVGLIKVD